MKGRSEEIVDETLAQYLLPDGERSPSPDVIRERGLLGDED